MEQVCLDRNANGKAFDGKLIKFWEEKYSKKKDGGNLQTQQQIERRRTVKTYNDGTIRSLLLQQADPQHPRKIADAWDDNDTVGDWKEEARHLI